MLRRLLAALAFAGLLSVSSCGGGGGGGGTTPAPTPAPSISSFTAAASSIPNGTSTTLTAVFANGSGSIDQGVGGIQSGVAVSTGNLTATRTYTLTVSGTGTPATAQTTVTVQPPPISVSITPNGATLLPGGTQTFTATVTNSTNQAVIWTIQEGSAGGTVSSSGLYTAPAATGTFHVVATSQADTSRNTSVVVTVSAPFTLSVSPVSVEQENPATTRIQINRFAGYTGPVTLGGSNAPVGLSGFFETTIAAGSGVELSLIAGSALAAGTYNLNIVGTALGVTDTRTLPVTVTSAQGGFKLAYTDAYLTDNPNINWLTSVAASPGTAQTLHIRASQDKPGPFSSSINLAVEPIGGGITGNLGQSIISVGASTTLAVTVPLGTPEGRYPIRVKGTAAGMTRWLDTTLEVAGGLFYIKPIPKVSLVRNSALLEFPMDFSRSGPWYYNASADGTTTYLGSAVLVNSTLPSGIGIGLDTPFSNQSFWASEPFGIVNAGTLTPGNYTLPLGGRRTITAPYTPGNIDAAFTLNLRITDPAGPPDLWIHNAEWAQTVISRDLRLVEGKAAYLIVQVMADRAGVSSPTVQATFRNGSTTLGVVSLTGPATIPNVLKPGEFTKMFKGSVPASWVAPGLTVDLTVDPSNTLTEVDKTNNIRTLTPPIGTGRVLDLKLVPIIHKGLSPRMPNPTDVRNALTDYWPLRDVQISQRAIFVTDLVLPDYGVDPNGNIMNFTKLKDQIWLLRAFDRSASHYYGMFQTGYSSGLVGLSQAGLPEAVGWDDPQQGVSTLVHELGHGFNLRHAPNQAPNAAGGSNLEYPYALALIGTWGYRNRTDTAFDPSSSYDVMSYSPNQLWISDFNYGLAQAFFESIKDRDLTPTIVQNLPEQMVILGSISPSGEVSLSPVHRIQTEAMAPKGTGFSLELTSESGMSSVNFEPQQIQCLPDGWRSFMFTLPLQGELQKVRVLQGKSEVFIREATKPLQALAAIAKETTSIKEEGQALKVRWDRGTHPYLTVIHEGEETTTLTVNHGRGSVDLPVNALPKGGRYRVILSDGLNSVERIIER